MPTNVVEHRLVDELASIDWRIVRIIAIDTNPSKFELARQFGATECINPKDHDKPIQQVLIEMTGLADPAPVLHTIMYHPYLMLRFRLDSVVTVVDAVNGEATLDAHEESVKQAAVAPLAVAGIPHSVRGHSSTLSSICPAADAASQCPAKTLCPLARKSPMTLTKFVGPGTNE